MMASFTLNDAILFFAFLYSSSDIFVEWESFETCKHPIQYWLLISYASIIAFRISHCLGQCLSDDGEDFILYRQRGPPFWLNVLILGVLFPFFLSWTIVGTVWFSQVQAETPQCLPRESHPWFFVFWLLLCYIWIVIYILFIVLAVVFEIRARRAERDLQLLQNEDMLRRWGRINVFAQYGIHILKKGLTTDQIQSLPHQKLSVVPVDQTSCSICLEDYHVGDDVRLLQPCGHLFHKSCIDIWLLRNAVCPNCKGSIFCPSSSSSSSTQCSGNSSERDCEEGERPSHLSGHPNTEQRNSSAGIHPREGVDDLPFYRGREAYADSDDIFDEEAWIGEDPSSSSRNFHSPLRYVLREDSSRL